MERIKEVLYGRFWTRFYEMLDAIEVAGYYVDFATEEFIEISNDDDERFLLYIDQTGSTLWISRAKAA